MARMQSVFGVRKGDGTVDVDATCVALGRLRWWNLGVELNYYKMQLEDIKKVLDDAKSPRGPFFEGIDERKQRLERGIADATRLLECALRSAEKFMKKIETVVSDHIRNKTMNNRGNIADEIVEEREKIKEVLKSLQLTKEYLNINKDDIIHGELIEGMTTGGIFRSARNVSTADHYLSAAIGAVGVSIVGYALFFSKFGSAKAVEKLVRDNGMLTANMTTTLGRIEHVESQLEWTTSALAAAKNQVSVLEGQLSAATALAASTSDLSKDRTDYAHVRELLEAAKEKEINYGNLFLEQKTTIDALSAELYAEIKTCPKSNAYSAMYAAGGTALGMLVEKANESRKRSREKDDWETLFSPPADHSGQMFVRFTTERT